MIFSHPVFKHSKFVCLTTSEKTSYLCYKLKDYFNQCDHYQVDSANGFSQTFYTNQVCVSDFYDEVTKVLSPQFNIPRKLFMESTIRLSDQLKRLLKVHDLEKSFRSCFETYIAPIYGVLKKEALEKKHAEANRVAEHLLYLKEQENIKQNLLNIQKIEKEEKEKQQKEQEQKLLNFKNMVLEIGNEWDEE